MDEEAIAAIQRQTVPKLLDGPFRCGVFGEIPVHDSACADVEDDEDVQSLKGGGHHDEEVAGESRRRHDCGGTCPTIGPIGHRGFGAMTACSVARCAARASDRASGGAPPRCAPRPTYGCSSPSPRSVAAPRWECAGAPVDGTSGARRGERDPVPSHERLGTHNRQELAPFDESRQEDECDSRAFSVRCGRTWRST